MKLINLVLLSFLIVLLTGCSGATIKNNYSKKGSIYKYRGETDFKNTSIKITKEEKGETVIEIEKSTDEETEGERGTFREKNKKLIRKDDNRIMVIEKVDDNTCIIKIKERN